MLNKSLSRRCNAGFKKQKKKILKFYIAVNSIYIIFSITKNLQTYQDGWLPMKTFNCFVLYPMWTLSNTFNRAN